MTLSLPVTDFSVKPLLDTLESRLDHCLIRDRDAFVRRLGGLRRRLHQGKPVDRGLNALTRDLEASQEALTTRRARLPRPDYDDALPINQRREDIAALIRDHQVVVVCGETGSGKTTQLPKLCLELGLGAAGLIGHTQPRRIAARSVASRISQELSSELGDLVGYKVRFSDRLGPHSLIKLMTDGILLAETQGDPDLRQYEVLIIDEAHERSLNIDFLLGYLKRLLPRRPDLKVIITSATIDPQRFSRHFNDAPVIEVSGRTYPVEVRYRPLAAQEEDERDRDQLQAILDAVDELAVEGPGDVLVFLSGEREIRETAEALRKHHPPHTEILPLYARLSAAEQNKVFAPHRGRRIVLATNVAETSLTVPGIRYVVDPGLARISRYSTRAKVQRLPIEKVSQASANQRKGRCGRVAEGICIRLYDQEDFQNRPEFTDPEILRTNLAAVILQMAALRLGEVEDFPFVEPPDRKQITDGYKLLFELQAVDEQRRITELGRRLARLPIDPRLGRMVLAGEQQGVLREALITTSALAIQDPRERPLDKQQAADQAHRRFHEPDSDFLALLNLWDHYHQQARKLSKNQLRNLCREEFLSYVRLREWHDLFTQLHALTTEMGMKMNARPIREQVETREAGQDKRGQPLVRVTQPESLHEPLHKALLTGLLGHLGLKQEDNSYLGARGRRFHVFPGSGLFKKPPKWIMAAELVETTRLYARVNARVDPRWVEPLAAHLIRRNYGEPHWEKRPAQVAALESVTLYGLPVVSGRRVNYGPIDPETSRVIFIRRALVEGEYHTRGPFFRHNRELIGMVEELEAKVRRRDLLADEQTLFEFYDQRIPADIYSGAGFEKWRKRAERDDPKVLFMDLDLLLARDADEADSHRFPDFLHINGMELPLEYVFEPGDPRDGVTVTIPLAALNQVDPRRLEWLVPGLLEVRMAALLKGLPKTWRRHFVPVPDYARALREALVPDDVHLHLAMAAQLKKMTGLEVPEEAWRLESVPDHLKMNVRIIDPEDKVLGEGRELTDLRHRLKGRAKATFEALPTPEFERDEVSDWDFGELPREVAFTRNGIRLRGFPALVVKPGGGVAMKLLDTPEQADTAHRAGVRALLAAQANDKVRYLKRSMPGLQRMSLHFIKVGRQEDLREDLTTAILERAFLGGDPLPRDRESFQARLSRGREQLVAVANDVTGRVAEVLASFHEVNKRLSGNLPLGWFEAVADIRDQLDHLVYQGFVSNTPWEWLQHLPRYLKGVEARLDKLKAAPDRDRQRRIQVDKLWERYKSRKEKHDKQGIHDPELETFRWMIEELRVSLFAQELKTALPVSAKRLEDQWEKVRD